MSERTRVYVTVDVECAEERVAMGRVTPPLGYDPAPIFERPDHPNFGLLKLTPRRIELATLPTERQVWRQGLTPDQ